MVIVGVLAQDPREFIRKYRESLNGVTYYGYEDAKDAMAKATQSMPVIGCDKDTGEPVSIDLHNDSPHTLLSMGSGGGKSVALRSLLAQFIRNGAAVFILDYKRNSHRWANRVPGVVYSRDIPEIHEVLQALAKEGDDRFKASDNLSDEEFERGEWKGQQIVIAVEELNSLITELEDYWQEIRTQQKSATHWQVPRRSPAIKALHKILAMGRGANVFVLAVAQRASTAAMGGAGGGSGGDARENFQTRILARHTHQTWKMLVPDCDYISPSEHLGRAVVVVGAKATETQILYLSDDEAVEWATRADETEDVSPVDRLVDVT